MFFDVKNHILYGTKPFCMCADDENMALVMAFNAYENGCRFILATPPHSAFLSAGMYEQVRLTRLVDMIHSYLPDMQIGLGCELECTRDNIDQLIRYLDSHRLPTLHGTRWVLVSFPENVSREDLWYVLDRLDRSGYAPVLSHAETLRCLDLNEIRCLKGEGPRDDSKYRFRCRIQLDTYSLHPSDPHREQAENLIRCRLVDVLGTNARNTSSFPGYIQPAIESMKTLCSEDYLNRICCLNAAHMLDIPVPVSQ